MVDGFALHGLLGDELDCENAAISLYTGCSDPELSLNCGQRQWRTIELLAMKMMVRELLRTRTVPDGNSCESLCG